MYVGKMSLVTKVRKLYIQVSSVLLLITRDYQSEKSHELDRIKVSILRVVALWGDCMGFPADLSHALGFEEVFL